MIDNELIAYEEFIRAVEELPEPETDDEDLIPTPLEKDTEFQPYSIEDAYIKLTAKVFQGYGKTEVVLPKGLYKGQTIRVHYIIQPKRQHQLSGAKVALIIWIDGWPYSSVDEQPFKRNIAPILRQQLGVPTIGAIHCIKEVVKFKKEHKADIPEPSPWNKH